MPHASSLAKEDVVMSLAFCFLLLACFAAIVAFGGFTAGLVAQVAGALFALFLVLMVGAAVSRVLRKDQST